MGRVLAKMRDREMGNQLFILVVAASGDKDLIGATLKDLTGAEEAEPDGSDLARLHQRLGSRF